MKFYRTGFSAWRRAVMLAALLALLGLLAPLVVFAEKGGGKGGPPGEGDPEVLALMQEVNEQLAAQGFKFAVEEIEFFTIGEDRPSIRIHQEPFRWVPGDPRRSAQGDEITYLVDQSDGGTTSGLSSGDTGDAIDGAMATWNGEKCLKKVDVVSRTDGGSDPDIFDSFFGFGGFGNYLLADIVHAGWLPKAFFEAVGGAGGGDDILAFSVTFIFDDGAGNPTDINGDNRQDTALNEVYYNDGFSWEIDPSGDSEIDVETVALHESGHSLGIGHFGPPPSALMNPIYSGVQQSTAPVDRAGMCAVWASWPK